MLNPDFDVARVETTAELIQIWQEVNRGLPNAEAWGEAVEAGTNDIIAARRAARAIGYITIRWGGPHSMETDFQDMVSANYPDHTPPAIYALYVDAAHRRSGVARGLMTAAERRIAEHPDTVNSVVLNVNIENEPARGLYESMGYRVLRAGDKQDFDVDVPVWNPDTEDWDHSYVKAVGMAKDLDEY